MSRFLAAVPAMAVLLALAGCDSGKEIADLGSISDSLRTTLPAVSDDVGASCERQNRLLDDTPPEERSATDEPQNCQEFQQITKQVMQDQSLLLAYLDAVGKLSSGGEAAFNAKLVADQTALNGYVGLPPTAAAASAAAQEVLGKLTDLTLGHSRRRKVAAIVRSADPAVQRLTKALREVMASDYPVLLGSEENFLANYYEGPMAARKGERLTLILVQRQYDTDRDALRDRETAAMAYGTVMTSIAELHGRLAAVGTSGSRKTEKTAVRTALATLKNDAAHLAAVERR